MSGLSRTYILPQKADIIFFKENLSIKGDINSFKLTNPIGVNQFQRVPGLEIKYFLNKNAFNFQIDTDVGYFRKGGSFRNNEKESLKRLILKPQISYAFYKKNYLLKTSLSASYLLTNFNGFKESTFLPSLNIKQSLKFYNSKNSKNLIFEPFVYFSISDQKKIFNNLMVDSGIRMFSLNEDPKYGDLFLSFEKDLNVGTKLIFIDKNKNKLQLKIEKLYTSGTKSLFYENKRLDFPDPLSLKIKLFSSKNINYNSSLSIDKEKNFSSYSNSIAINSEKYEIFLNHYLVENIEIFNLSENSLMNKRINSIDLTTTFNFSKNWNGGFKFINDLEKKKNINSVFSINYENEGLIVGLAYMKSIELDWISILENSNFKDYHKDRFRLYFELKGLGSIGRPKEDYLKRRNL
tara:strand:- start:129 stop:1349 length:1221 start_codon:yes stop_codon:yes gene_type:complete